VLLLSVTEIFDVLRDVPKKNGRNILNVMGHHVCVLAFCRLWGIGKQRYARIDSAIKNGDNACPIDMRFLQRPCMTTSEGRSDVFSFLTDMYNSVAETLPDMNDPGCDVTLVSCNDIADGGLDAVDPYTELLNKVLHDTPIRPSSGGKVSKSKYTAKVGPQSKRLGRRRSSNMYQRAGADDCVRFLPPGNMSEYFQLFKSTCHHSKVSFSLFWAVWNLLGPTHLL
jgi:hypothetical protein